MLSRALLQRLYEDFGQKKERRWIVIIALYLIQSIILLPSLYFIKQIFDNDIPNKDVFQLSLNTLFIILMISFHVLISFISRNHSLKNVKEVIQQLQKKALDVIIYSDKTFIDNHDEPELMTRALDDIDRVDRMLDAFFSIVIPQAVIFGVALIVLILFNPLIGLFSLVLGFMGINMHRWLKKGAIKHFHDYLDSREKVSSYIRFLPTKWLLFNLRNTKEEERGEAAKQVDNMIQKGTLAAKNSWKVRFGNDLFTGIAATLLVFAGALQVQLGYASYGSIFGLYYLIILIRKTISTAQTQWAIVNEGKVSLERIFEFIDRNDKSQDDASSTDQMYPSFQESLILENVNFSYDPVHPVLTDVSFEIKPGQTALISGVNGAGKSSLIHLILGFYKPSKGRLLLDDIPYDKINKSALRQMIGYLPQNQVIIKGTVRENLLFGLPKDYRLSDRIEKLVLQLLSSLPKGLDTAVQSQGKNLSAGQIQKISLLRSMIGSPKLIILDEPTNHLDVESISTLVKEIRASKSVAMVIISHTIALNEVVNSAYILRDHHLVKKT